MKCWNTDNYNKEDVQPCHWKRQKSFLKIKDMETG